MADENDNGGEPPHTVKAGVLDALLGNRGPNGELMRDGKPALVRDLPDEADDEGE
jgi:hypothetical protein